MSSIESVESIKITLLARKADRLLAEGDSTEAARLIDEIYRLIDSGLDRGAITAPELL